MVDHPFERRPATVKAVRPFARPTEDAATSPTRGSWAGRPTPFVSPAVPEPNALAPESDGQMLGGPATADGGRSSELQDAELAPPENADSPSGMPRAEASAGEHVPYPSWDMLMEEQGVADSEASIESRSESAEHRTLLEHVELADEGSPGEQTAAQIADAFWADAPDQAELEHAATSDRREDVLRVIDLDEHDVEAAPSDAAAIDTSRTDEAEASRGAEEQPTQDLSADESPLRDWRPGSGELPLEVETDDADRRLRQSEMDVPMSANDILLSEVSSYVVEHPADAGASSSTQGVLGDIETFGDHAAMSRGDAEGTERDGLVQRAADHAPLSGNEDDSAAGPRRETETRNVIDSPATDVRGGRSEVAAAVLERLANRLRRGDLMLPASSQHGDDALTLAQVLTALLGAAGQGSHDEPPPPATGTER